MAKFQSYKDGDKSEKLNFPSVMFHALTKLFDIRCDENDGKFQKAVNAMEMIMSGFTDDKFAGDLEILERQKEELEFNNEPQVKIDLYYFNAKANLLSSLIYRVNKEKPKIREFITQSEIVKEIARKLVTGTGQNVFITGATGSGKSYTGVQLAYQVCKITGVKFDIDNVIFTPEEFTSRYNDEEKTPEGGWILFDEAGVKLSNREWNSKSNKAFSQMMQIIRHRKLLVIFTAPDLTFIDTQAKKMLHWWLKTEKIDKRSNICYITPQTVEVQQRSGDVWYPFPKFDGNQLSELRVQKLPANISKLYESKAKAYKDELAKQTELSLATASMKGDVDPELKVYITMREDKKTQAQISEITGWGNTKMTRLERGRKTWQGMQIQKKAKE